MLFLKYSYLGKDVFYTLYALGRLQKVTILCVYTERLLGYLGTPDYLIVQKYNY